jgi:hypothetical protein
MTDKLTEILVKTPVQRIPLSELKALLQQINGEKLNALLQRFEAKPELQLPVRHPSGSNDSIKFPVDAPSIAKTLSKLPSPLPLTLTPTLNNNRLSFDVSMDAATSKTMSSSQQVQLTKLINLLQHWGSTPRPIIEFLNINRQLLTKMPLDQLTRQLTQQINPQTSGQNNSQITTQLNLPVQSQKTDQTSQQPATQVTSTLTRLVSSLQTTALLGSPHNQSSSGNKASAETLSLSMRQINSVTRQLQTELASLSTKNDSTAVKQTALGQRPTLSLDKLTYFEQSISKDLLKQQPLSQVISSLRGQLSDLTQLLGRESPLINRLQVILNILPEGRDLTAKQLQQQLMGSGVFKENHLMRLLNAQQSTSLSAQHNSRSGTSLQSTLLGTLSQAATAQTASQSTAPQSNASQAQNTLPTDLKALFTGLRFLLNAGLTDLTQSSTTANSRSGFLKSLLPQNMLSQSATAQQTDSLQRLLQDVESGLARTRVSQFQNTLPNDSQQLVFDLPMMNQKQLSGIQLKFEDDNKASGDKHKTWRVTIRFEFENLGAFHAIAELKNKQFNVRFIAEKPETQQLLMSEMPSLEKTLTDAGILVKQADATTGNSPELILSQLPKSLISYKV